MQGKEQHLRKQNIVANNMNVEVLFSSLEKGYSATRASDK